MYREEFDAAIIETLCDYSRLVVSKKISLKSDWELTWLTKWEAYLNKGCLETWKGKGHAGQGSSPLMELEASSVREIRDMPTQED